jgi:phage gpG-like protein
MSIDVTVNVAGAQDYLDQIAGKIGNMSEVMGMIGEIILSSVDENFERGGRYKEAGSYEGGGSKWVDLKPGTKKARARKGKWPGKILLVKGQLVGSLHPSPFEDRVEIGSNLVYAAIHNFGGTIHRTVKAGNVRLQSRHGKLLKGKTGGAIFSGSEHQHTLHPIRDHKIGKPYTITIPARPFMVVQDEDLTEIIRAVQEFLTE